MGLKIVDLLKWKTFIILTDSKGNPILDEKKKPIEVYLRVIDDDQLEKAHRAARLASANIRRLLRDKDSEVYKDRVAPIMEASKEECIEVISQYRTANLPAEARANVVREELPTVEEFAIEPDAPTLEEMEKLDAAILAQEDDYQKSIDDYVTTRTEVIKAELEGMSLEDLRVLACDNVSGVLALAEFFTELVAQKIYYGAFRDKEHKIRAFDSVDEFVATDSIIKEQIIDAYTALEYDPDSIKK